eukprot:CAMPEP_0172502118 /NCGR_PEP_ID=MMETSP1066-20121228/156895_1 /TAXON_ID=671091 /ORGANISM="Coscinodiscus wailesii, Strain CCMP2513" /LENGTH=359 /DNA_ID=CAMNT_0013277259 /DNA_START=148 /DNA_END=1230 /DNA_ORIENTATION=+
MSRLYTSKTLNEKADPETDLTPRPPSTESGEENKGASRGLLSIPKKIVEPLVEPGIEKDVPKDTLGGSLIISFLAAYAATADVAIAALLATFGGYLALTRGPLGDAARGLGSIGMTTVKVVGGVTQETTSVALEIAEERKLDLEAARKVQEELLLADKEAQKERMEKLASMKERSKELDDLIAVEKKWNKKTLLVTQQRRLKSETEELVAEIEEEDERISKIKVDKALIAAERQKRATERKAEKERIAAEKEAERERLAAEKAEQDRIKAEKRAEEERLAAEKAEKDRIAAEKRAEEERIAAEKKAEEERIAAEIERKKIEEEEKMAAEIEEQQRLAMEWQKKLEDRRRRQIPCDQDRY